MAGVRRRQRGLDDLAVALATTGMGQSTQADHFVDTEGKPQTGRLRQHGQAPGAFLSGPGVQIASVQAHLPGTRGKLAAQRAQQATLAGTIGAEHTQYLARAQLQADIAQHFAATALEVEPFDVEHQLRTFTSRNRKNGAPMNAVTMPIGSSAGARARRAIRSANSNNVPPASSEAGSSTR